MKEEVLKDIERVLSSSKEPMSLKQLMDATKISYYVLKEHLEHLISSGKVKVERRKRRKKYRWVGEQAKPHKKKQDKKPKVKEVEKKVETRKEDKGNGNQIKFTRNVMSLFQYFVRKYGIEDLNVAINYIMLRGLLLEVKATEVDTVSPVEIWSEMVDLKNRIKRFHIRKLAKQRIERLQEESKAQEEALTKYLN